LAECSLSRCVRFVPDHVERQRREQRVGGAGAVMFLAPWLVCALLAWLMWWLWERHKRR